MKGKTTMTIQTTEFGQMKMKALAQGSLLKEMKNQSQKRMD